MRRKGTGVPDGDPPQRRSSARRPAARPEHIVEVRSHVGRLALPLTAAESLARLTLRLERAPRSWVTLEFCGNRRVAQRHRDITGVAGPTDIVTLEHNRDAPGAPVVGEVWIAPAVARTNARAYGVTLRMELARLVVHGVLHVLGHQHPEGAGRERSAMWRRQETILRAAVRQGVI